jgi:hypothetical protein
MFLQARRNGDRRDAGGRAPARGLRSTIGLPPASIL